MSLLDVSASLYPIKDGYLENHHAVWMHRVSYYEFVIYVGKDYIRRFTLDTLPELIKEKLVLIHSVGNNRLQEPQMCSDALREVGWLVGDSMYQIILSDEYLKELSGGAELDTGRKSQKESEGSAE